MISSPRVRPSSVERVLSWAYVLNRFAVSCLWLGLFYVIYAIVEELTQ